ncbi:hypothetical protein [Pantoea sp. A4]|uniref:hypothetical protein n=1 Tax=Pantoea sp. A4 TaxID=1225184 RepID=UPI0005601AD6|nr:hypothetical protein [Pantoea sp. A4]
MQKNWKSLVIITVGLALAGCSTAQKISRPDGKNEYLIQCGASSGWDVCYSKANEVCPAGYTDLDKDGGFNRKELRILCAK